MKKEILLLMGGSTTFLELSDCVVATFLMSLIKRDTADKLLSALIMSDRTSCISLSKNCEVGFLLLKPDWIRDENAGALRRGKDRRLKTSCLPFRFK